MQRAIPTASYTDKFYDFVEEKDILKQARPDLVS
jgi:hypothetical protein